MSVSRLRRVVCLDDIRGRRDEILASAESYGVRNIRVFGSVARGEADVATLGSLKVRIRGRVLGDAVAV